MSIDLDESARQRALDAYRLVDSLPEAAYQDIVQLASTLCETPIALVTLIDRERQWFKANIGLDDTGTRRDEAFCNHAIAEPERLMEVPDAHEDARFVDNRLVTGELGIRFYAGMPLVGAGGAPFGTVCVLDRTPRQLDERQKAGLAALARLTMTLFEARRYRLENERAELLAQAAIPVEPPPVAVRFSIALFELLDHAGSARRIGERAVERALQRLDDELHARLRPGDSVDRVTGSAELIAVLHGDDTTEGLQALRECVAAFEADTGLQVLNAHADSESPEEKPQAVYMRAELALSAEKDARYVSA
jgi:GAF domain-containing protein